jgi:hypothetical protein
LVFAFLYAVGLALFLILRTLLGDGPWWLALLNSFAPLAFFQFRVF